MHYYVQQFHGIWDDITLVSYHAYRDVAYIQGPETHIDTYPLMFIAFGIISLVQKIYNLTPNLHRTAATLARKRTSCHGGMRTLWYR